MIWFFDLMGRIFPRRVATVEELQARLMTCDCDSVTVERIIKPVRGIDVIEQDFCYLVRCTANPNHGQRIVFCTTILKRHGTAFGQEDGEDRSIAKKRLREESEILADTPQHCLPGIPVRVSEIQGPT
jgi:hypothetical protein